MGCMGQCNRNKECKATVYEEGSCSLFHQTFPDVASPKFESKEPVIYAEKKTVSKHLIM